ncbi:hypothetical protein V6R21_13615 [Limibacter armeniacum]|uniref:hypothetical protein n=1 Tax=Limibacter armeniacum TaxID=466084 RepID=UPI002FE6AC6C
MSRFTKFSYAILSLCAVLILQGCEEVEKALNIFNMEYSLGDSNSGIRQINDVKVSEVSYTTIEGVVNGESGAELQLLTELAASLDFNLLTGALNDSEVSLPLQVIFNVAVKNSTDNAATMSRIDVAVYTRDNSSEAFAPADIEIAVNSSSTVDGVSSGDWVSTIANGIEENGVQWDFGSGGFVVEPNEVKALPVAVKFADLAKISELVSGDSDVMKLAMDLVEGNTENIQFRIKPYVNMFGSEVPTGWITIEPGQWMDTE